MKKITLVAVIGLIGLCSCKKERTCTCTNIGDNGSATVYTVKYTKINKREAKDACSNRSTTVTYGSNTTSTKRDCKLS
jgi:hypothetical protein